MCDPTGDRTSMAEHVARLLNQFIYPGSRL